jgi:hypothetical protein
MESLYENLILKFWEIMLENGGVGGVETWSFSFNK